MGGRKKGREEERKRGRENERTTILKSRTEKEREREKESQLKSVRRTLSRFSCQQLTVTVVRGQGM